MCKQLILLIPLSMIYSPYFAINVLLDNQKGRREEKMSKLQGFILLISSPILVVLGIILYIILHIYLINSTKCCH
jgi:hypothetical protein